VKLLALLCVSAALAGEPLKASKRAPLTFPDGQTIQADVVDTPLDRERGLMFRRKLARDYGMLFVFPAQRSITFWMKNTLVPLDMVFIDRDKTITAVFERVRASTEKTPDSEVARAGGVALYVLELPAGAAKRHKLAEGQALRFETPIPKY
jgi:uncharacterized protein